MRFVARLVAWLPFHALGPLGAILVFIAYDLLRIRRAHVLSSIAAAGIDDRAVARRMFRSLGQGALELLWLSGRPRASLRDHVRIDGWDRYEAALALGRGVIVATAHTGNWDLTACACAERTPLAIVTKRLSSKSLDRFWQETRRARGLELVAHDEGVVPKIRDCLARGKTIALLVDQDPERTTSVIEAEFLGRNALHDVLPATMAARSRAPIVVAFARRDGAAHIVEVIDVIVPPPQAASAWIGEATRSIARHLDAFVRRDPSCWLWLHRRWKTQRGTKIVEGLHANPVVQESSP